jgi:hypothetical protein
MKLAIFALLAFVLLGVSGCGTTDTVDGGNGRDREGGQVHVGLPF